MLGDAGEHYAVSQFTFHGLPATKMPDGWEGYDLAIETGSGLARVSVKTRSQTDRWSAGKWWAFHERRQCDWLVCVFQPKIGLVRAWVIPFNVALRYANGAGTARLDPYRREISFRKLTEGPFKNYENNWRLTAVV